MPPEKPGLLVLTSTFPRDNTDATPPFVWELSRRLTSHFKVTVLAPRSKGTRKREDIDNVTIQRFTYWCNTRRLLADGAILPTLKMHPWLALQIPTFILSELFSVWRLVRKENISLVHAHWIIPQGFVCALYNCLSRKKLKTLVTSHGADMFGLRHFIFLKKWILNSSDIVTSVSGELKQKIEQLNTRKTLPVEVFPMGVDFIQFHPLHRNEHLKTKYYIRGPFLLFVGRLSEKKGVHFLLHALPAIIREFTATKLLIIGDGEEKDTLTQLVNELDIGDAVHFCGGIPNNRLREYYATADIFIGPSITAQNGDREGFGLVFVEAMGSGTVTIGTNLPAISDIISDGKTGVIVEQQSAPAIAEAVINILKNPEQYDRIARKGAESVRDKFDWSVIAERYTAVLTKLYIS